MIPVKLDNNTFQLPENWNELTGNQLLRLADMFGDVTNLNEFLIKMWLVILDLKVLRKKEEIIDGVEHFHLIHKSKKKKSIYLVSAYDLQFAASHLRWMFTEKMNGQDVIENTFVFSSRLTKNLIPEIKHSKKVFAGPDGALTNITFAEYILCETYFNRYNQTSDVNWLNKFVAVLYRPVKSKKEINSNNFDGDKRITFNAAQNDRLALLVKNLPTNYKRAILIFYEGCRNYIAHKFPLTFKPGGGSDRETFESLMELTITLKNETGDNLDTIRESMLYDILLILENMAEKAAQNKK